ncbi:hypothetical protein LTR27_003960 [Elasticomyces elasticus]|nr:hypothetical protein LTR27_003960 [Elasticomyces elasticus]
MLFQIIKRRSSSGSTLSTSSSKSSLDSMLLETMLPIAPREDDYNMAEKDRQARLLAKCKRAQTAPFKDAKPLPLPQPHHQGKEMVTDHSSSHVLGPRGGIGNLAESTYDRADEKKSMLEA